MSCVKGKEKQTVGELYDLFESVRYTLHVLTFLAYQDQLASELWPIEGADRTEGRHRDGSDDEDGGGDLEAQVARELAAIKRPRTTEKRFGQYAVLLSMQFLYIMTLPLVL